MCEGEHWDGQDATGARCTSTTFDVGPQAACASVNSAPDPVTPDPFSGSFLNAHQQRASVQYGGAGAPAAHWYGGQFGAGQMAVYASADGTVAWWGKDGTNQIQDPSGRPVFAPVIERVNNEDRLPFADPGEGDAGGNIIAWVVGVQGDVMPDFALAAVQTGESDCSQADYEADDCPRDNTAVTVELLP